MISIIEYFGPWMHHSAVTEEVMDNAGHLLECVDRLMAYAIEDMVTLPINPVTNSQVSGEKYGGFRPPECTQGSPSSSHKRGQGVDVYDPHNDLDEWITDEMLEECGLYREHPTATQHWCHLTTRAPGSGHRTFLP